MSKLTRTRSNLEDLIHENDLLLREITNSLNKINETISETNNILRELQDA